ncbi:MAG: T9SS type A sorting domain-containing protein [Flavobacteriaceae bacterium]|nr:T9SS type A sorting domain-containing protein [Mangrovimonas sp.]MCB0469721.1 T9SS type A sorting domain-containing protein [Flavobacteriaceae bacterium]MCB0425750.1 T9SS type A sorting domain-containing protein [Mangrovimonas sp.]MCB0431707.1 T9SS type A sorting domain-containing protein [Mangrovimonas sp.]MCB0434463.1 T9SS type A sorting domain-containing protein [Mangrovimonas sp.]
MKKLILLILATIPLIGICQNELYIGSGATITANSELTMSDAILTNNGTYNGALKITGSTPTSFSITNNNSINFTVLNINGSNNVSLENNDINVSSAINLNSDNSGLFLGSANILLAPSASIFNESNNRVISGAPGTYIFISKTHSSASPEPFGNIGFQIDAASGDLGNTDVYRRYGALIINESETINRYYEIIPSNNSVLTLNTRFYFLDTDLNGLNKLNLEPYQSPNGTSSWQEFTGSLADSTSPYITTTIQNPVIFLALAESGITLTTEELLNNDLKVYPNPASETVNIQTPSHLTIESIIITDMTGKKIEADIEGLRIINVSNLSKGLYLITIETSMGTTVKKLAIE